MNETPKTKQEAFAQLDEMLSEKDKNELANGDAIEYHFSLGMWIRNNWIYEQAKRMLSVWQKHLGMICGLSIRIVCQERSSNHIKDT